MPGEFTAGQNAPLPTSAVRFTASAAATVDPCAFVVDDRLQVASSGDVVFYNQPTTAGVRLDGAALVVDLAAVPAGARVLCAVGIDRPVPVTTMLTEPAGTPVATFAVHPTAGETALLCWELYRHRGSWKIRALGQGYTGGLAAMFTAHGVEVDDGAGADEPAAAAPVAAAPPPTLAPGFEWLWRIFEDAARSTAAVVSAHEYAQHRLDDELSAAVADPATRFGPAAEAARARAQGRRDELVAAADARHRDDSARLRAELDTVDPHLPAALASWSSPAWRRPHTAADGVRVGAVSIPGRSDLRVPLCVPLPLHRPLWVSGDDAATNRMVTALAVRLLAAHPGSRIDIVDPAGALAGLCELTAPVFAGPPILTPAGVTAKLQGLADNAELETVASTGPAPRVLVVAGVPHGYRGADLTQLLRITQYAAAQHISMVIAGSDDTGVDDPAFFVLHDHAQHLSSEPDGHMTDPWTGSDWTFTPDTVPADTTLLRQVVETLAGC